MENPSELWLKRDHKHDLAFRPLETALETGVVDAIYSQSKPFQHLQEATGKFKAIEDLSRYPDWTLQVANIPAVITCTDVMADEHPELVVTFMKGMIKVGRWANEHKHAAAAILDKQTFYLDVEDTYGASSTSTWSRTSRRRTSCRSRSARTSCTATATSTRLRCARVGGAGVPGAGGPWTCSRRSGRSGPCRACPRAPNCTPATTRLG